MADNNGDTEHNNNCYIGGLLVMNINPTMNFKLDVGFHNPKFRYRAAILCSRCGKGSLLIFGPTARSQPIECRRCHNSGSLTVTRCQALRIQIQPRHQGRTFDVFRVEFVGFTPTEEFVPCFEGSMNWGPLESQQMRFKVEFDSMISGPKPEPRLLYAVSRASYVPHPVLRFYCAFRKVKATAEENVAARECQKHEEVAMEGRWGSIGQQAVSVSSGAAGPYRDHLCAVNHRRGHMEDSTVQEKKRDLEKNAGRYYLGRLDMKARDSTSGGKRQGLNISAKDTELMPAAVSCLNKFDNDGSFLREFNDEQKSNPDNSPACAHGEKYVELKVDASEINKQFEVSAAVNQPSTSNQLATKVTQLGKHKEVQKLLKESENIKAKQSAKNNSILLRNEGGSSRYHMQKMADQRKEEDADMYLAQKLVQNKFSIKEKDDEYDSDGGPRRKTRTRGDS